MSMQTQWRAGLGSRVALRTFVLFCVCAIVPILILAAFGYRTVSQELTEHARERLEQAGKNYGLLVYERLAQTDVFLEQLARLHEQGAMPLAALSRFSDSRVTVVEVSQETARQGESPASADAAGNVSRTLEVVDGHVRLQLSMSSTRQRLNIVGEVNEDYLWADDAAEIDGMTLCAFASAASALHCSSARGAPSFDASHDVQTHWSLFLKPRYGVAPWTFRASQPVSLALADLASFKATLPIIAGVAILIALLVSSIQIRRSHKPLEALVAATRRIGRRRFHQLTASGRDEFTRLAQAFNRMAHRLERQLRALSAFARLDKLILADPSIAPIVATLLPRALKIMGCDGVVTAIEDEAGGGVHLTAATRTTAGLIRHRSSLPRGALERLATPSSGSQLAHSDSAESSLWPELRELDVSSMHVYPLRVRKVVRGLFLVGWTRGKTPSRSALQLAHGFASRLSMALANEDRERALLRQAYFDSLTGLANRQLFMDRLEQTLKTAQRSGVSGAVFFIDLDRFKNVNDALGHQVGDRLLCAVSERFAEVIREVDTLARLGGDEFTVIAPALDANGASALGNRLMHALDQPISIDGVSHSTQASIGVALYPADGTSSEAIMRNADTAMYRAKARGRGTLMFFESEMNEQSNRRLRIEQRLREALERRQLEIHYQPKISARTGLLAGAEALTRWTDAEFGPQSPMEFIPVAEDAGLIEKLGDWALDRSCADLHAMREYGVAIDHVAVNVSMRQLREPRFPSRVREILEAHALQSHDLQLEVTESALAENLPRAIASLTDLRSLGVRVAMDDFGTGYSTMAMLQQLPLDTVKIDRAFVSRCTEDASGATLIKALIAVIQALGKTVVAEGVETSRQAQLLRSLGCEILQGYLYARPMPIADLVHRYCAETGTRHATGEVNNLT